MALIPESVPQNLSGKVVLIVWGPGNSTDELQRISEELRARQCGQVVMEHVERLLVCKSSICLVDSFYTNDIFFYWIF